MTQETAVLPAKPEMALESSAVRKVFVKTYGCQMNVYDSDRMADALAPDGYVRPTSWKMPISSSSTPATSARRRPKRSIRRSAVCAT